MKEASRLRVFMTADTVGGVWQYALDLAEGLRPHGVEAVLAILGPSPDQQILADAAGIRLVSTDLPLDWTASSPDEVLKAGECIARLAALTSPDIVHLNNPALAAAAAFPAPVVAVCHSCVATWWQAVRTGRLPDEFVWQTDLVRKGYQAADRLLAPSAAFAHATATTYALKTPPLVIHNGRRFVQSTGEQTLEPFAFTAGRLWDEGKDLATLDRAAERIAIPVMAAGPLQGPNGAQVAASHVQAPGRLTDAEVARYLGQRPIFVSTARYEPFGLAVLEAAQAGCSLILSDIPTFRELWGSAALFVPPGDDKTLAQTITHLAQNRHERDRLGRRAQKTAQAYTLEAMSMKMLHVYRSLVSFKRDISSVEDAA
ncbi:glycosyltransferase family 4 protein [Microvirga rosea]|uniref:glycosyltransferase family 4 protein n=1 Tax=Microvirga rosea TaxID=2715425 RepID=UPI001D0A963E|nr:glycosyltransferase family 4 protein [Microvirga rosea]MCB8821956.1 glycosyltransferase family 4 protein [Microvirga rosea]